MTNLTLSGVSSTTSLGNITDAEANVVPSGQAGTGATRLGVNGVVVALPSVSNVGS